VVLRGDGGISRVEVTPFDSLNVCVHFGDWGIGRGGGTLPFDILNVYMHFGHC
jgi:hypothetical protein